MFKKYELMLKNEKGFTLMEMIISIATVALISGFILQMFIVSSSVNERAKDLDQANLLSLSAIELFKSGKIPEDFVKESFVHNGVIKETESETNVFLCYDDQWNNVNAPENIELYPNEQKPEEVKFLLQIKITHETNNGFDAFKETAEKIGLEEGVGTGQLYRITAQVKNCDNAIDKQDITVLSASKYFTY